MKKVIVNAIVLVGIACACYGAEKKSTPAIYKTRQGDTLSSIAKRFRIGEKELAALNPSTRFDRLQVGQPIRVRVSTPAPLMYPTRPPQIVP